MRFPIFWRHWRTFPIRGGRKASAIRWSISCYSPYWRCSAAPAPTAASSPSWTSAGWSSIAIFGVDLKRAPVVNTLRTVLQSLDTEDLEEAFRRHAKALLPAGAAGEKPVIALDGKTLRGSFDHINDRKAAQTLTAFASASAIVLAHTEIDDKSNEIPAAQQMIRDLGLTGVSSPPMPCTVKKTFEAARDTGNVLIAQVKANQPILHETLEAICNAEPPADSAETVDRNRHGRQEHRRVETFDVAGRLGPDWDGLIVTAARVNRLTWHKNTKTGLWHKPTRHPSMPARPACPRPSPAPRSDSIGASKTAPTTSAMSPSSKMPAASVPNRATSPGSAPSPSISCAPTPPPTSAESSTSTPSTPITPCHTEGHSEN